MAPTSPKHFDVWFVQTNTVYKQVPYRVVTDWVQQARLGPNDMVKVTGTPNWMKVEGLPLFQAYEPKKQEEKVGDTAEALEPIELDFNWKKRPEDDDDDVDMIPLIDISLVLLIFFMMTTTVAQISHIAVPSMENAVKIDTTPGILRVDIDLVGDKPIYALGSGTAAPEEGNANLPDVATLATHLDEALNQFQSQSKPPPKVRIAAHGELPYATVEAVMKELETRRRAGNIDQYHIEVNERAAR